MDEKRTFDEPVRFYFGDDPMEYIEVGLTRRNPSYAPALYLRGGTARGVAILPSSGNAFFVYLADYLSEAM